MHRGDADGSRTAVGPVWSWKMGSDFGLRRSGLELACFDLATTSPTKGASLGTGVAWKKAGHAQAGKDIQFQELPAWDAFDRHVLRFSGYFKEPSLWGSSIVVLRFPLEMVAPSIHRAHRQTWKWSPAFSREDVCWKRPPAL